MNVICPDTQKLCKCEQLFNYQGYAGEGMKHKSTLQNVLKEKLL